MNNMIIDGEVQIRMPCMLASITPSLVWWNCEDHIPRISHHCSKSSLPSNPYCINPPTEKYLRHKISNIYHYCIVAFNLVDLVPQEKIVSSHCPIPFYDFDNSYRILFLHLMDFIIVCKTTSTQICWDNGCCTYCVILLKFYYFILLYNVVSRST